MTFDLKSIQEIPREILSGIDIICMGHFNVLHPGHFRFINFAASKGKQLGVLLKGDQEFEDSEKQFFFPEEDRAEALNHISGICHIFTRGEKTIVECLELIKPKFFVLGHEFERDRSAEFNLMIKRAESLGIQVIFHSGDRNLNFSANFEEGQAVVSQQDVANQAFMRACARRNINLGSVAKAMSCFGSIKTLVIGDLIVDEFISSEPLGLSSEAPVVVVKEIEKRQYIGGAGVVASHVASMGAKCHFLSVSGDDAQREFALQKLDEYNVQADLIVDKNRPTTFKTRYIAGKQKLFRVSRLMDTDINVELEDQLIRKIEELAPLLDNIIVSDFVYGVITDRVLAKLVEVSAQYDIRIFGDLQCSSQVGNVLKFQNFDMIFPTEKEARIAINNKDDGLEFVSQTVFERSHCNNLVIKLGANGLIAYSKTEGGFIESEHFPALSINPVDVSGAGDSVLAAISTAITSGMNMLDAAALGCVVASCAVEILGNFPIDSNRAIMRMEDLTRKSEIKSLN